MALSGDAGDFGLVGESVASCMGLLELGAESINCPKALFKGFHVSLIDRRSLSLNWASVSGDLPLHTI